MSHLLMMTQVKTLERLQMNPLPMTTQMKLLATQMKIKPNLLKGEEVLKEIELGLRGEAIELGLGLRGEAIELGVGLRGEEIELGVGLRGEEIELGVGLRGEEMEQGLRRKTRNGWMNHLPMTTQMKPMTTQMKIKPNLLSGDEVLKEIELGLCGEEIELGLGLGGEAIELGVGLRGEEIELGVGLRGEEMEQGLRRKTINGWMNHLPMTTQMKIKLNLPMTTQMKPMTTQMKIKPNLLSGDEVLKEIELGLCGEEIELGLGLRGEAIELGVGLRGEEIELGVGLRGEEMEQGLRRKTRNGWMNHLPMTTQMKIKLNLPMTMQMKPMTTQMIKLNLLRGDEVLKEIELGLCGEEIELGLGLRGEAIERGVGLRGEEIELGVGLRGEEMEQGLREEMEQGLRRKTRNGWMSHLLMTTQMKMNLNPFSSVEVPKVIANHHHQQMLVPRK